MLILLSPAKKLHADPTWTGALTQPRLLDHAQELMGVARELSVDDLKSLMHISDNLAELNHARFQSMSVPFTPENAQPAVLSFAGDVYVGLDAASLDADAMAWAQEHVRILSGLYGALRPLDLMQAYRLEMGSKLKNERGGNLYAFWKEVLAPHLKAEPGSDVVLNLASNEYSKAVDFKALGARVITPVFKEVKDGKSRVISFFAKKARGRMARWAIEQRVQDVQALQDFDWDGYAFVEALSTRNKWVFERPQPPPKS